MKNILIYSFVIQLILSSCAGNPPMGHVRASGFSPSKVILQSTDKLYVSLSNSKEPILLANQSNIAKADTFYLCDLGNNIVALQSMKEQYVSIHLGEKNQAVARQNYIAGWEKLTRTKKGNGIVFLAANYHYLQPDSKNNNTLTALSKSPTDACVFNIIELP